MPKPKPSDDGDGAPASGAPAPGAAPGKKPGSATKPGSAASKPGGAKGKEAPPPEPELSQQPGEPIQILVPELRLRLNPLVVTPVRAKCMPDQPATREALDRKCEPARLRLLWPPEKVGAGRAGGVGGFV